MSPSLVCRFFATYLVVTLVIYESPTAASPVHKVRTTTLKPIVDLTAEPIALQETRQDLPKNNNVQENTDKAEPNIKNAEQVTSPLALTKILDVDNKPAINFTNRATSTVTSTEDIIPSELPKNLQATTSGKQFANSEITDSIKAIVITPANIGYEINDDELNTITTSTRKHTETDSNKEEKVEVYTSKDMITQTLSIPNALSTSEKIALNDVTDTTGPTETMSSEGSSRPAWKTYTTIERKRTTLLSETPAATELNDELAKSETIASQITLEPDLDKEITSSLLDTEQTDNNSFTSPVEPLRSPLSSEADITTPYTLGYMSSKRAGFLDLTAKQVTPEETTTGFTSGVTFNETDLIGAMFEIDDDLEAKKTGRHQPHSQVTEDVIKEELLKEEVINDNFAKQYLEDKTTTTTTGASESVTEDSLSVKPINSKANLYTVSSHYKPMKKIAVLPLKPFLRDPDDNSWRNESLSQLGIVFKATNASKPFTQVLKNKTESQLSNINEKYEKNEVSDLRERLEKIAEIRKSKKKKLNTFGDTVYSDYEERTSSEMQTTVKPETVTNPLYDANGKLEFIGSLTSLTTTTTTVEPQETVKPEIYFYKEITTTTTTSTKKPKKYNKFPEYYDATDDDDADYITLPKLDLKKFTTRFYDKGTVTTPSTPLTTHTKFPKSSYLPERKPTIQYFPPRNTKKMHFNDYDSDFQKKINLYTYEAPKEATVAPPPASTRPAPVAVPPPRFFAPEAGAGSAQWRTPSNSDQQSYVAYPSQAAEPADRHNDETFNRASYVIKHYKDLIDEAVKADYDKSGDFGHPYTTPASGARLGASMDDDFDYVADFRKDLLNRFVDNFNRNSERYKVDFPVLYNNSVVHMKENDNGKVIASSTAFLKRVYDAPPPYGRPCEPHCELKVELSPEYELHYYVPDQEEKEQVAPKPATIPYYRL